MEDNARLKTEVMMMGIIGFILSLVAGGFMLIGLIPFLGWLNWITTLPAAVAAAVLCGLKLSSRSRDVFAITGLIISILIFVIAISRLWAGCGII
jgi:hypothetical protein